MGWTDELYHIYELVSGNPKNDLLPISHSTANAQIEVIIDERGCFKGAHPIEKEDAVTVIPVTEDSGARSSGISPMPFADKLVYLAGDYKYYAEGKHADNADYYNAYIEQLKEWSDSLWTHPAVKALVHYLEKSILMEDLIKTGVLTTDPKTRKLLNGVKISGIAQEDSFVRFVVQYNDLQSEANTWADKTLQDCFIAFNDNRFRHKDLCYATGREIATTYKHPSKIRNGGDKAKLISSNDESGFTYRGRFSGKEEALSVSYEFSQKMHNALKWLINKQGQSFGPLTLVIWASALENLPNELKGSIEEEWDDEESYDSLPAYKSWLKGYLLGYKKKMQKDTKVMVLGLDAATPGRVSVSLYEELSGSVFLENLESWHENSAWLRYDSKRKGNCVKSFSLYEIIRCAYGLEQNGKLECDESLYREQILRLLPCVMFGKALPDDLVKAMYNKASNPLSYDKQYNHRLIIEAVCGMMRAQKKGERPMGYDKNETDRSYLYGCLLAIADKAEEDTYNAEDRNKRVTNARRYWANFAQKPYQTWQNIEERLKPYLNQNKYRVRVEKWLQEIMEKFTPESFTDNRRLDTVYLLGYHHFMSYMYNNENKEEQ